MAPSRKTLDHSRSLRCLLRLALTIAAMTACAAPEVPEPDVNELTVRGTDYAFDAPRVLPPGRTAFAFENAGRVPHEMILVRLKEGVTLQQVLAAAQEGGDPEEFTEGGAAILIAGPGETAGSRTLVELLPGRTYALVCNFQDAADQPPHVALGMTAAIEVAAK
jgi:hypothetical protein